MADEQENKTSGNELAVDAEKAPTNESPGQDKANGTDNASPADEQEKAETTPDTPKGEQDADDKPKDDPVAQDTPAAPAVRVDTKLLYGIVADTMPMEGRDFSLDVSASEDGRPRVTITPITDIGKTFAPLLASRLSAPMNDAGVAVVGGGEAVYEVMTVRKIREKIEADEAAARAAKIRDVMATAKAKDEELKAAYSARVAKAGETSPVSQEELAAERELKKVTAIATTLKQVDIKIPLIRSRVDHAARDAAEKDAKTGRSWAVDMDAPLTTEFDRRDATAKFTEKEKLIANIAELSVNQDRLAGRAIALAKQYIIEKK